MKNSAFESNIYDINDKLFADINRLFINTYKIYQYKVVFCNQEFKVL